jgi:hypothetical protein
LIASVLLLIPATALAGTAVYMQANPMAFTSPKPAQLASLPALPKAKPIVVASEVVVELPEVRIVGKMAKPVVKTKKTPAPCKDGEYRVIGFTGDPENLKTFQGVYLHCPGS